LLHRRGEQDSATLVSLDTVRELAEATPVPDARLSQLDEILAHPTTRDEFYFLREVAQGKARVRRFPIPAWLAAAALLVVTLGVSVIVRARMDVSPEVMRGGESGIRAIAPAANAQLDASTRFIWNSVQGATSYTLELIDGDGNIAWRGTGTDTAAVLPADLRLRAGEPYTWVVRVDLADGTSSRSAPRSLRMKP
jgi:hypothetical protein